MMDINQQILEELKAIRRLLTIFSQDKLEQFHASIKEKYLTPPKGNKCMNFLMGQNL